ncbi:hypothetical protein CCY99_03370 [Helicobacter sp. 16-1353]|uniref:SH3 domain-containing protein n=1 Tax=Helicobacter sp. 16-1353 TaxID=2004996 RepID=UPI000DCD86D1|nr:SH3 domain-containing protein [Helicobacter sp. 16-1353]RAX54406.1 hypothetical protein CCY99_03370 [Helicobacter sp. 16-1353]
MQGKYRIYLSYFIVILIGILLYLFFIFFISYKIDDELETLSDKEIITKDLEQSPIELETSIIIDSNATLKQDSAIENPEQIYTIKADVLNIREEPNTQSKIIKQYVQDDNIIITNIKDGWGELKNGGFAYMELLSKNNNPNAKIAPDTGVQIYTIKADVLNIREEPNTQSKIIDKLLKDEKVQIRNIDKDWGELLGGGYVYMELLEESDFD